ncbi:hypothetical protein HWV62_40788 [Athelia sp. TMB]|nr:hypothetical protein HWV62_40788 [Athelia sp. TMB]
MFSPSKKRCFVAPQKLKCNVCSMCGHVVYYPAYTRLQDANVLMDNHMNLAHPISKRQHADSTIEGGAVEPPAPKIMDEELRRMKIEVYPYVSEVRPKSVYCFPCGRKIRYVGTFSDACSLICIHASSLDKRHRYFVYPYNKHCKKSCMHIEAAEIWREICATRREACFFPDSSASDRRKRADEEHNAAGRPKEPRQCWTGSKRKRRFDVQVRDYDPDSEDEAPAYSNPGPSTGGKRKRQTESPSCT